MGLTQCESNLSHMSCCCQRPQTDTTLQISSAVVLRHPQNEFKELMEVSGGMMDL